MKPNEFYAKFTDTNNWIATQNSNTGFYPQLVTFASSSNTAFGYISLISTAQVNVCVSGETTGRDYVYPSSASSYSYAYLTNSTVDWHISGGVDEYLFDPDEYYDSQKGARNDGLSGNTYSTDTGKYLFTKEGDTNFTAEVNGYERTICVHVSSVNPYFSNGAYNIYTQSDLDGVRLYCHAYSDKTYTLKNDLTLSGYNPITGFQGSFDGAGYTISGLSISPSVTFDTENAGFFADIAGPCTISDLHISGAEITGLTAQRYKNAGLLVGKIDVGSYIDLQTENGEDEPEAQVNISCCIATGSIFASDNGGLLVGRTDGTAELTIERCATSGQIRRLTSSQNECENAGGILGSGRASVENCYSSAVLFAETGLGGIIGDGDGSTVSASLFAGMLESPNTITKYPISSGTNTDCLFDTQTTAISSGDGAKTTESLIGSTLPTELSGEVWSAVEGLYPQLSVFNSASDKMQTAYTIASLPVIFGYNGATSANSLYFDRATIGYGDFDYTFVFNGGDTDGKYTRTDDSTSEEYVFTVANGGAGVEKLTFLGYNDVRYFYFNVRCATIYYKFNMSSYDKYLLNCGSGMISFDVNIPNNQTASYSCALDTSAMAYGESYKIVIPSVMDTMTFTLYLPYQTELDSWSARHTSATDGESLKGSAEYTINIPSDGIIYLDLTVSENPNGLWGNYSFYSN